MCKFLAILVLALVICGCGGCGGSDKKPAPQKPTVVYSTYSNEQLQEMRTAYRQVLTNTLKPICVKEHQEAKEIKDNGR